MGMSVGRSHVPVSEDSAFDKRALIEEVLNYYRERTCLHFVIQWPGRTEISLKFRMVCHLQVADNGFSPPAVGVTSADCPATNSTTVSRTSASSGAASIRLTLTRTD